LLINRIFRFCYFQVLANNDSDNLLSTRDNDFYRLLRILKFDKRILIKIYDKLLKLIKQLIFNQRNKFFAKIINNLLLIVATHKLILANF
jgi:hypothetical protein